MSWGAVIVVAAIDALLVAVMTIYMGTCTEFPSEDENKA